MGQWERVREPLQGGLFVDEIFWMKRFEDSDTNQPVRLIVMDADPLQAAQVTRGKRWVFGWDAGISLSAPDDSSWIKGFVGTQRAAKKTAEAMVVTRRNGSLDAATWSYLLRSKIEWQD